MYRNVQKDTEMHDKSVRKSMEMYRIKKICLAI